uniref:Uncharacterized protein n=1 Tax=Leersia perrieri TaxID=77586 RepID=A0A0D9XKQ9_9ORYZ
MAATAMAAAAAMVFLAVATSLVHGEERPTAAHPHGLPFESPLALSPDAYDFFHPKSRARRGAETAAPAISPYAAPRGERMRESAASVARADQEEGGVAPVRNARRGCARAGTVAGVVVGAAVVAAVAAALAVAYAVARRRVGDGEVGAAAKTSV